MAHHPDDALTRFDFARQQVAQLDAEIQSLGLQAHINGARLSEAELKAARALLSDLAEAGEKFCDAARALDGALDESGSAA